MQIVHYGPARRRWRDACFEEMQVFRSASVIGALRAAYAGSCLLLDLPLKRLVGHPGYLKQLIPIR